MSKRIGLSVIGMVLVFSFSACSKSSESPAEQESVGEAAAEVTWFTAESVADGVWRIDDHGSDNMYLVEGEDKALLIDTGTGIADLAEFVRSITNKPLIIVNTHGHPDHAGGNFQFVEVSAHPADFEMAKQFSSQNYRQNAVQRVLEGTPEFQAVVLQDGLNFDSTELLPIRDGGQIDLGGRTLEVIEVPGHTPGSIVLLDAANRLLFAGDDNNTLVWLFLQQSLPLEVYLQSLEKLNRRAGEFDTIFPGHGTPLDAGFLEEQIACVRNILDGNCEVKPYQSFAGDASQCSYERATVAFDRDKLRVN